MRTFLIKGRQLEAGDPEGVSTTRALNGTGCRRFSRKEFPVQRSGAPRRFIGDRTQKGRRNLEGLRKTVNAEQGPVGGVGSLGEAKKSPMEEVYS